MNQFRFAIKSGLSIATIALLSLSSVPSVYATSGPVVVTDSGSAEFVAGDNTTSTPVAIASGLTVTDGTASTLASATVAITGNLHASEDVLSFINTNSATYGNISSSYNASTGVLTLTSSGATATIAKWQAALDSVTYTDTAVTPNNSTRTVSFTVIDTGSSTSNTATQTVTVTDRDQTPIVTTTGRTTNYVTGTSATTIDGGVSVTDRDNTTQSSATVSISSGFHSGDTLTFVNTSAVTFGNIVGSYNSATGVLTLTSAGATATDLQWSDALSAVTFATSSQTPGNRTVSFAVNDGTKSSAAATDIVDVLGLPTITTDSGSAAFVAGDNTASTPVTIDSGLTVTDGAAPTLASATVAITGNFHSVEDVLSFTNTDPVTYGNISASYNSATGVLTLTSSGTSATLVQWQAALDAVTYTDTAITPYSATRTVSFTAFDTGATISNTATRTVTVTDRDQTPIVTTTGGTTNYVTGTSATTIDGGVSVTDRDNTTQSSATVSISSGFHSGDTLTFVNTSAVTFGNIVGSYNSATGVLTLTSAGATATDLQWSDALSAVTFATSSQTPGNRTVSFAVSDGTTNSALASKSVVVESVPGAPVIGMAVAGNTQATVYFTPPANDGGSAITGYTVTASPGGATGSGASSPITVRGLTNGAAYTFTVTAVNGVGTGPASDASNAVQPALGPFVTGVSPSSGTTTGGTVVTITGVGFTGATAVDFGGTAAASFTVNSSSSITATVPAGTTGLTDVRVTTPSGTSAINPADQFTYTEPARGPVPPYINTMFFTDNPKIGTPYQGQISAVGGAQPFTWSIANGSLPKGLTLNNQGVISGTPTGLGGQYTFTVHVMDANHLTATRQLTLTVDGPTSYPAISKSNVTPITVGKSFSQTLSATGGSTPYTWSVTQGTLPTGLALNPQTGALTGTPTTVGQTAVTVRVTDAYENTASQMVTLDALKPDQRAIVWNGKVQNVPAIVGNDGGTQTTYMPIWYVMQLLKQVGIESAWDGHTWKLATMDSVDTSNVKVGTGNTGIYVNEMLIQDVNTQVGTDPSTGHATTYMPIYYVEQILKRFGLSSTWDGTMWTVTQASK